MSQMSSLIVEVCTVDEICPHPNANQVELIRVKNWWCVSQIGQFKLAEKCVYFPPDCVISEELANKFGIAKYLSPLSKNLDGSRPPGLRIRAQRFRGERSFGFITKLDDPNWEIGQSLIDYYGVTKYEPPIRPAETDSAPSVSAFHGYTDIENLGNFPGVLVPGEEVVVDEKTHGNNLRTGKILTVNDETGEAEFQYMCGSHGQRRKEFDTKGIRSKYWQGLTPEVKALLDHVCDNKHNVIVFSELYGAGVQDMAYGRNDQDYLAFDIAVNGKYLNYDEKERLFKEFGVNTVPFLYRGPFSLEKIQELTDGPTEVCDPEKAGKFRGREGCVTRPVKERYDQKLPNFGRVIFKSISVDYLARKGGTEFH
jgi:RNA ligase (TIGR02306 family)